MITVTISINGNPILCRSATREKELMGDGKTARYNVDDGSDILHNPNKGAVVLAKKMLDKINKDFVTKEES